MKELKIEIPNGYEIDLYNSDFSKGIVKFKEIIYKYPLDVKHIEGRNYYISTKGCITLGISRDRNNTSTKERAEAFLALMQLVELRDAWNKVDKFEVDWSNNDQCKFTICRIKNVITSDTMISYNSILYFKSKETRDLFRKTFEDLLETAKELL